MAKIASAKEIKTEYKVTLCCKFTSLKWIKKMDDVRGGEGK